MIYLLSNNSDITLTPDGIRRLAAEEGSLESAPEPPAFKIHRLEARLGPEVVAKAVSRYESGESATAIAKDLGVAPSALLRLLSQKRVVVRKHGLTPKQDTMLARAYEAGATMAHGEEAPALAWCCASSTSACWRDDATGRT